MGVKQIYIDDVREEFVRDFVFPMFRANALYEGTYMLGTSIARPLIAKRQIEIAIETGADAVCHGATGKGNDQVRAPGRGACHAGAAQRAAAPALRALCTHTSCCGDTTRLFSLSRCALSWATTR